MSTCLQSFASVPWSTARSSFRKTCFADKKSSSLERAHVYSFISVMSVVLLRFYRLAMSYKHETEPVLSKKVKRDFFHGRKNFRRTR